MTHPSLVTPLQKKTAQSSIGVNCKTRSSWSLHTLFRTLCGSRGLRVPAEKNKMLFYAIFTFLAIWPLLLFARNRYIWADVCFAINSIKLAIRISRVKKRKPFHSVLDRFLDKVATQPQKSFIVFEGSSYTYREADRESNRLARALQERAGLKQGDTVALFAGNEPNFVWTWLAVTKLGCTASLLNSNIRSKSLLHCFSCCGAKVLVAAAGETLRPPGDEGASVARLSSLVCLLLADTQERKTCHARLCL